MKLWHGVALFTSALTMSSMAQADFLGVYGSVDYWHVQGDYSETAYTLDSNNQLNRYTNEFSLDKSGQSQFALSFEHPVPLIPNARIRHVGLDVETEQKVQGSRYGHYDVNLDNTDFILYYEILDNIVSADVGLAAKRLDGDITFMSSAGDRLARDISETTPMVYGSVGAKLPFTGLSAKAELLATNYSDNKITDLSAEVKYNFVESLLMNAGAKVGYRLLNIDLDDQDGFDTKFRFQGPYIGLEAHF